MFWANPIFQVIHVFSEKVKYKSKKEKIQAKYMNWILSAPWPSIDASAKFIFIFITQHFLILKNVVQFSSTVFSAANNFSYTSKRSICALDN